MRKILALFLTTMLTTSVAFAASRKVTDLTEDTSPATNDLLMTVDVSDTTDSAAGSNKKVTVANITAAVESASREEVDWADVVTATVWNGTPPGGTVSDRVRWSRIGNVVYYQFRYEASSTGVSNTRVDFYIQASMPAPVFDTPVDNLDMSIGSSCQISTGSTSPTGTTRCAMVRDDSSPRGGSIRVEAGSSTAKYATASGFYLTSGY